MSWVEHRTIKEIEIEDAVLHVEVEVTLSRDHNYGADADGRRGEVRDFIDDVSIEAVYDLETGQDVTETWKDSEKLKDAIESEL